MAFMINISLDSFKTVIILGIENKNISRSRLLERIHNDCETKTSKTSSLSLSLFRYRDLRRRSLSLPRIVTIRYTASFVLFSLGLGF